MPVVPLEYERAGSTAWTTVVRTTGFLGAIVTALSAILDVIGLILVAWNGASNIWNTVTASPSMGAFYLLIVVRGVLTFGCIEAMRFKKSGRYLVIWSSLASVVAGLFVSVFSIAAYHAQMSRYPINLRSYYFASVVLTYSANFVRSTFVPVVLWYFFRRAEVRELFRR